MGLDDLHESGSLVVAKQTNPPRPMQAVRFLHKAFSQALPTIHSKRLSASMSCVSALLHGHRLTLSYLGRSMPSEAYTKHSIKRVYCYWVTLICNTSARSSTGKCSRH